MKILVIDDTKNHLDAALQVLEGHEVTVCSGYDEALKLLEVKYNEAERSKRQKAYEDQGLGWTASYKRANGETRLPYWDAVLCDLLMPAGKDAQGTKGYEYVGKETLAGWSLALLAAKRGAKYAAVATDMNHHNHPGSAMLDRLDGHLFEIDGAKMLLTNHVGMVGIKGTECKCKECGGTGKMKRTDGSEYSCCDCENGVAFREEGKDWTRILDQLLGKTESE
jgi:CheY-like chemotaxis protein